MGGPPTAARARPGRGAVRPSATAKKTPAVVHQYEPSEHSRANVTCLDCHQPHDGQATYDHYNFRLARDVTSLNCQGFRRQLASTY